MLEVRIIEPMIRPAIMSAGWWTWRISLERAIVIIIRVARIEYIIFCFFVFVNMQTRSPKNTTANVVWPEGNEYPVSWINISRGLGDWIISFSILIVRAVVMEAVTRRIAERLRASLWVLVFRLKG